MSEEVIRVENMRRLDVQPGDRFVLTTSGVASEEQRQYLMEAWRQFIGDETPLLVLPEGWEIGVIREVKE